MRSDRAAPGLSCEVGGSRDVRQAAPGLSCEVGVPVTSDRAPLACPVRWRFP